MKRSSADSSEIIPHESGSRFRPELAPISPNVRLIIDDAGNAPRLHDRFKVTVADVSKFGRFDKMLGVSVSTVLKLSGCAGGALPQAVLED